MSIIIYKCMGWIKKVDLLSSARGCAGVEEGARLLQRAVGEICGIGKSYPINMEYFFHYLFYTKNYSDCLKHFYVFILIARKQKRS